MIIPIEIDDDIIKNMHKNFCNKNECVECPAEVLIGESYNNCHNKYKDKLFEQEIKELIQNTLSSL